MRTLAQLHKLKEEKRKDQPNLFKYVIRIGRNCSDTPVYLIAKSGISGYVPSISELNNGGLLQFIENNEGFVEYGKIIQDSTIEQVLYSLGILITSISPSGTDGSRWSAILYKEGIGSAHAELWSDVDSVYGIRVELLSWGKNKSALEIKKILDTNKINEAA